MDTQLNGQQSAQLSLLPRWGDHNAKIKTVIYGKRLSGLAAQNHTKIRTTPEPQPKTGK